MLIFFLLYLFLFIQCLNVMRVLCHVLLFVPLGIAWSPYAGCFAQQSDPDCQGLSVVELPICLVRSPLQHTLGVNESPSAAFAQSPMID